ncbi:MAG: hypothetical protein ACI37Z_10665 [Candidatus Gastranaerophilaceae bacterium]
MANITVYTFDNYKDEYNKVFAGVYNDFKSKAVSEYNFELEPLEYNDFVKSVEAELIKCIILFEQDVPTGFLTYTTVISESLELNMIHVIGDENSLQKRCLLLQKFLEENQKAISEKVVTFTVLGKQTEIIPELPTFGFYPIKQSVMKINFQDEEDTKIIREMPLQRLKNGFEIVSWNNKYYKPVCELLLESFKNQSDAKFDPRFTSMKGIRDITDKITAGVYGEFLPQETKILLYKSKVSGVCFANLTNSQIANIPLVAVKQKFQGKSFGNLLLKSVVKDVYLSVASGKRQLGEINACCDSNFEPAFKMYLSSGFKESYSYTQAYRPIN